MLLRLQMLLTLQQNSLHYKLQMVRKLEIMLKIVRDRKSLHHVTRLHLYMGNMGAAGWMFRAFFAPIPIHNRNRRARVMQNI